MKSYSRRWVQRIRLPNIQYVWLESQTRLFPVFSASPPLHLTCGEKPHLPKAFQFTRSHPSVVHIYASYLDWPTTIDAAPKIQKLTPAYRSDLSVPAFLFGIDMDPIPLGRPLAKDEHDSFFTMGD